MWACCQRLLLSSGRSRTLGTPRRQRNRRRASECIERRESTWWLWKRSSLILKLSASGFSFANVDRYRIPAEWFGQKPKCLVITSAPDFCLCIRLSTRTPFYAFLPRKKTHILATNPLNNLILLLPFCSSFRSGCDWDNSIYTVSFLERRLLLSLGRLSEAARLCPPLADASAQRFEDSYLSPHVHTFYSLVFLLRFPSPLLSTSQKVCQKLKKCSYPPFFFFFLMDAVWRVSAGTSGAARNDRATGVDGTEGEFDHTDVLRAPADLYDWTA